MSEGLLKNGKVIKMLSWYRTDSNGQMIRITEKNVKLFENRLIIKAKNGQTVLKSENDTSKYLYGDILFMVEKGSFLEPMQLPTDLKVNPLVHPQIQEFITSQRLKLRRQINQYEDILDSLKTTNFQEEHFEKEFFDEFKNLRNNLYKNSGQFLKSKLNNTQNEVEMLVKNNQDKMSESTEDVINFTLNNNKKKSDLKRNLDPKVRKLFS